MLDEYYQFRRNLVDVLERDLLGPGADEEVIAGPPTMKYVVGVLFPARLGSRRPSTGP